MSRNIIHYEGGKPEPKSAVEKARKISCAIKCVIAVLIGIVACVALLISENEKVGDIYRTIMTRYQVEFVVAVIGILVLYVYACSGKKAPEKADYVVGSVSIIERACYKRIRKRYLRSIGYNIKDVKQFVTKQSIIEDFKETPMDPQQAKTYTIYYRIAGVVAGIIIIFFAFIRGSIPPPPPPPPPAVTTTVPVTTVTDPVTEPTTSTVAVTETTPVTEPPETTPPTTKQTEPTDPPPTTTTDPLIYADNYTYTYISTLSNGEETTETVVGKAIVGYAGADSGSDLDIKILDIPDDVAIIADDAFQYCIIHELHLGQNVQVIGQSAFSDDSDFDTVYLPGKLRYIGAQAFFSSHIVRTFYLNEGRYPFLDRMCFGTPDPFGRPDQIVICETDGTSGYDPGECTAVILERIDALMHGTAELGF